jgi:hypothetical protein
LKSSLALALLLCTAGIGYGFAATETVFFSEMEWMEGAATDTTEMPKLRRHPVPKKAGLYSLILPGAGQVYNGSWWKVPFVYGALGGAIAVAVNNQQNYETFRDAYTLKLKNEPHEFSDTVLDDARRLRVYRDRFNKNRQTWYLLTGVAYGLQAVEALVDAHLQDFDVDEDLSLRLKPSLGMPGPGGMAPGIGIVLRLN